MCGRATCRLDFPIWETSSRLLVFHMGHCIEQGCACTVEGSLAGNPLPIHRLQALHHVSNHKCSLAVQKHCPQGEMDGGDNTED